MFVNFYSLILLSVDSVMHLCPFCNRRIIIMYDDDDDDDEDHKDVILMLV